LNEPVRPLPVRRSRPAGPRLPSACDRRRQTAAANMACKNPADRSSRDKPWGTLPWPPWRSTRLLARHPAAWDTIFAPEARAVWRSSLKDSKVMSLSGSNDRPVPDGGNPVLSGTAGSRKAAERLRLAQALRANLGRRKAQKIDRRKQAGVADESKTARGEGAQNGASTKQD
jgi:hypothetical protein